MINVVNNSFVTRVRTTRFLEGIFILFYIQELFDVFRQFLFLKMRLFTLYVLEFFQVASAIELHIELICAFCHTAISPHSPLRNVIQEKKRMKKKTPIVTSRMSQHRHLLVLVCYKKYWVANLSFCKLFIKHRI